MKKKKKIVQYYAFAHQDGKNLYKGDCFENSLLLELNESAITEPYIDVLKDRITNKKAASDRKLHPQDILNNIFLEELYLDYEEAKQLSRLDVVDSSFFYSSTTAGNGVLYLLGVLEIRFVVSKKVWTNEGLYFEFQAANNGYEDKAIIDVNSGLYYN